MEIWRVIFSPIPPSSWAGRKSLVELNETWDTFAEAIIIVAITEFNQIQWLWIEKYKKYKEILRQLGNLY